MLAALAFIMLTLRPNTTTRSLARGRTPVHPVGKRQSRKATAYSYNRHAGLAQIADTLSQQATQGG
jgi:hypothetical protein